MGGSSSRIEKNDALRLCKERKRFIKQAIDSRYALAAAHLCYVRSLRNIGIALRRFAEAELLMESSLPTSATELDRTPSHSSYLSRSPSQISEMGSPLHNESPFSPHLSTLSYMRLGGSAAVTVSINPPLNGFVDDESMTFLAPPPPPEAGSSWDYFDPTDEVERLRFIGENGFDRNLYNMTVLSRFRGEEVVPLMDEAGGRWEVGLKGNGDIYSVRPESKQSLETSADSEAQSNASGKLAVVNACSFSDITPEEQTTVEEGKLLKPNHIANGSAETLADNTVSEQSSSKRKNPGPEPEFCAEMEDPSEFITHRAKDFLSSIKDIEHRFVRASEAGKEVSRMLETSKIRLSCSETKGRSPASVLVAAFDLVFCRRENLLVPHETPQQLTKITWNRSSSSQSSSSKNPLATASKDVIDDSESDIVEEFCMFAGTHSSTLDRLYAWERKLYDEVKAGESIKKVYDQKCDQLRHQFARDLSPKVIDRTRAVVKDLHSRIKVAIHAVDTIAKRIEKLRDEELQPQLVELIHGLIQMWKAMLECHHAQYITMSLAYLKKSTTGPPHGDSHRQVLANLQHEIECFGSSFADWIDAQRSYVNALNGWLQNCIILPQERSKGRNVFCPRRALAPPIFVLCLEWSARIKTLPSGELTNAIKVFASDVHSSMEQLVEEQKKQGPSELDNNGESESRENEMPNINLLNLKAGLKKTLDWLTKFAEASLKMYEEIRQASEAAQIAYTNGKTTTRL